MKINQSLKFAIGAACVTVLAGCAVSSRDVNTAATSRQTLIAKAQESVTTGVPKLPEPVTRVSGNYLGGQVLSVSNSLSLPAAARDVVFNCGADARGSLDDAVSAIRRFTGLPIRVDAEVASASAASAPKEATGPQVPGPLPLPMMLSPSSGQGRCGSGKGAIPLSFSGDLADYLNQITASLSARWEYVNGEIHVYLRQTRVFTLMVSPGQIQYQDETNSSSNQGAAAGGAQSTSVGNFGATANAQVNANYRPWQALEEALKTMVTKDGRYTVNQSSGTLVVTDTEEVLDRIASWVKSENAALTRQVAVEVREISVQLNRGSEVGLDLDLVFQKLNAATGAADWVFRFGAPSTVTDNKVGTIGYNIARPSSRLAGSNIAVQALNSFGTVVSDQTRTVITTNRVPGRLVDVTDRAYLAATTPSTAGLTGSGSPGLTPGLITYGDNLIVVPTIGDNSTVLLQMFSQRSNLLSLATETAGSGATFQQITTPVTARRKNGGNFLLTAGDTLVIVGNESSYMQSNDTHSVSGASSNASTNRLVSVLLVTARVLPGV
jgi:type IVB pilus formation R64 PilN family outer membrane protein